MIIKLLKFFFNKLIGNLPEEDRKVLWVKFNQLLESAAEGAVKGAMKK